jgi:autotransporter-associated beta strand protein
MRNANRSRKQNIRAGKSQVGLMRLYAATAGSVTLFLAGRSAVAQNTPDNFTTGTDLTVATNYANSALPANTNDVTLTSGSLNLTDNSAASLTMGSLDVTSGSAYTITNTTTGSTNTILLGGGTNAVTGSSGSDLIYLSGNSSLTVNASTTTYTAVVGSATTTFSNLALGLGASGNFDVTAGSTLSLVNVQITGSNALTFSGAGTSTLSYVAATTLGSTYTGGTTISAGTVNVVMQGTGSDNGAGAPVATTPLEGPLGPNGSTIVLGTGSANATLNWQNGPTAANSPNLTYNITAGGTGTDTMTFTNLGAYNHGIELYNENNAGTTGKIVLDNNLTVVTTVIDGSSSPSVSLNDAISAGVNSLETLTLVDQGTGSTGTVRINLGGPTPGNYSETTDGAGKVAVVIDGNTFGEVFLYNTSNTYSGGTTIEGGTVLADGVNTTPIGGTVTMAGGTGTNAATFSLNGNQSIGVLNSSGTGSNTISLSGSTNSFTVTISNGGNYGGTLVNGAAGDTMSLTLTGGNLTLSGSNTYTGPTAVNTGATLTLSNPNVTPAAILGGTAVTVSGGAAMNVVGNVKMGTASAGTLTITGGATAPAQGILSLEDGTTNMFTLTNTGTALTIGGAAGSPAVIDLDINTTAADEIVDSGALSIGAGGATININTLNTPNPGTYTIISAASLTGAGSLSSLLFSNSTNTETYAGDQYVLTPSGNTETLVVTAIPEPASVGAVALGALALMGRRRTRK